MKALIFLLYFINNYNHSPEPIHPTIQIEFEYEEGSWVDYEVFAFDGKISYHFERSLGGEMEKKFVFDVKKKLAKKYQSSFFSKMLAIEENYSLINDSHSVKHDIHFVEDDRKEIFGFDCYKAIIRDKRANLTIHTYVTDELKDIPIKHFLNQRFPSLKGFPLEINAPRRTGKVFRIIKKIDSKEILKKEIDQDYKKLTKKNIDQVAIELTGQTSKGFWKTIQEEIKRQQDLKKIEFEKNNKTSNGQ